MCMCPDVNECEVYKADRGGPLCGHACVNVPGSYHCSCPTGYKLLADGRSCEGERVILNMHFKITVQIRSVLQSDVTGPLET